MSALRIAIATCENNELAAAADEPLVVAFRGLGIEAARVAWDDASADWAAFDGVLVRSTWDWHLEPERYKAWLWTLEARTRVWNSPRAIAWSLDKRCLIELSHAGVRTVPSVAIAGVAELAAFESPWRDWVIKPALGATAYRTSRIRSREELEAWRREHAGFAGGLIAQPFQATVLERGEVSLVFIGGAFSHAVRKVARAGDFRVQAEFGGTTESHRTTDAELELAARCLRHVAEPLAFARIDLLHDEAGDSMVIECELAEPELFFGHRADAAKRLARFCADRAAN